MKLSKKQFCTAVNTFHDMCKQEDKLLDVLNITPEWVPGEWVSNYYKLLSELCELEEDPKIGTTLDWFCFEIGFGKDKDNKIFDGYKEWTINSPEILYDYIMEVEN